MIRFLQAAEHNQSIVHKIQCQLCHVYDDNAMSDTAVRDCAENFERSTQMQMMRREG